MGFLGLGLMALVGIGGVWLLCRLLDGVERNEGGLHGGGVESAADGD